MIGAATVGQRFPLAAGPTPGAGGTFQLRPPSHLGGGLLGAVTRAPGFRLGGFRRSHAAQALQLRFNKALERVVCRDSSNTHDARVRARAYSGIIVSQHQTDALRGSNEHLRHLPREEPVECIGRRGARDSARLGWSLDVPNRRQRSCEGSPPSPTLLASTGGCSRGTYLCACYDQVLSPFFYGAIK